MNASASARLTSKCARIGFEVARNRLSNKSSQSVVLRDGVISHELGDVGLLVRSSRADGAAYCPDLRQIAREQIAVDARGRFQPKLVRRLERPRRNVFPRQERTRAGARIGLPVSQSDGRFVRLANVGSIVGTERDNPRSDCGTDRNTSFPPCAVRNLLQRIGKGRIKRRVLTRK